LLVLEEALRSR